ncbi:hypothetical protein BFP72_06425 [Reichenbachiella sp. 5M10]|uniref:cadherin domain-containing protein n=1 Tax=Reichenbachiella sp. 5M10 TaxID=1889772 RepID=UPI000C15FB84|nr:cadherin domain-containing protein [Reichenbachiella sp. 5M10]PIB35056.1 hypothetical protein BFP72_06425 [Reichenbachiella sp. 5M10]
MKNSFLSIVMSLMLFQPLLAQEDFQPFVTSWKLSAIDESVTIALNASFTYDFTYAWVHEGDTISDGAHQSVDGDFATVFSAADFSAFGLTEPDTVELYIAGVFPHLTGYTKAQLVDVNQWGDIVWGSFNQTFANWGGRTFSATDAPILSSDGVSFFRIFRQSGSFNGDLSHWDVSNVSAFNEAFQSASSFNSDLGSWELSRVTNFGNSFNGASKFQGHGLSQWDVSHVTRFNSAFNNTDISSTTYDDILISWSQLALQSNVTLSASGTQYCSVQAENARAVLINDFGWTIGDAGAACSDESDIVAFDVTKQLSCEIDAENHTVTVTIAKTDDRTSFSPVIATSTNSQVSPASGELQDFSAPVIYTVTAENGSEQEWVVTIENAILLSTDTDIVQFDLVPNEGVAMIDHSNFTVQIIQDNLIEDITPDIQLSPGASVFPAIGETISLTGSDVIEYTVTAEDGVTQQVWQVSRLDFLPFVSSWEVEDEPITLLLDDAYAYDFVYLWYEGGSLVKKGRHSSESGDFVSDLPPGDYRLQIYQEFPHLIVEADAMDYLLDVSSWGDVVWGSMRGSFESWGGERFTATDVPDLSLVSDMTEMFKDARNFNQDLAIWSIGHVSDMTGLFSQSGMSLFNFDKTLIGWSEQEVQANVNLGAAGLVYCRGEEALAKLQTDFGWAIVTEGQLCHDFCSGAITVSIGETVSGNTTFATNDSNVASDCGSNIVEDGDDEDRSVGVWYRIVGNGETITLNTCNGGLYDFDDTSLSVYTGSCSAGLQCFAGNEDGEQEGCGASGYLAKLSFNSLVDEEYFVLVDGYGSSRGEFDLAVSSQPTSPPPANDNCEGAEVLTVFAEGTGTPTNGTNTHATTAPEPQGCDQYGTVNDVWYRFNSGTNVEVSVTVALTDTDVDGPLVVAESIQIDGYETCGGESLDICESEGTFSMEVVPNTDYLLQLWNGIDREGTFTIQINDGPNTAATIDDVEVSLSRFATNGSVVETVIASDEEGHDQLYSITQGNDEGVFAIDPNTGEITIANASALQASASTSFVLTVGAADQGPGALTSAGSVTINIVDNEFPAVADQQISLDENSENGTVVIQVIATDDGEVDFTIVGGNTGQTFEMSSTGEITVHASEHLNFEQLPVFVLEIEVTDQDLELPLTSTARITINLKDINESPVVHDAQFNIGQSSPNGFVVGDIDFDDEDTDQSHVFSIVAGNDASIFGIDETSGVLTIADNSNLVADVDFVLTVAVADNGSPALSGTATVEVTSFSNTVPVISPQFFGLEENAPNGTVVATVEATDDDGDGLTFSIVGGSGMGIFSIDTDGELQVTDQDELDFEAQSSFDLRVRVTDDGLGGLFAEEIITINLTDVNEAPVGYDISSNMSAFVENGYVLGALSVTDPENDALTYTFVSGNEDGVFALDASTGIGTVVDASKIDSESTPYYDLRIEVSDGVYVIQVRVVIRVFTNAYPSLLVTEFDIDETSALGSIVATLSSDDVDGISAYDIVSGNEEELFFMNSETGAIMIDKALDFEAIQQVVLGVRITDNGLGSLETIENVTISINDVNEFAPQVTNVALNVLNENSVSGTQVGTVTCTDDDIFQTLSYAIIAGNTDEAFAINSDGLITVNTPLALDFETNPTFTLTVEVSDDVDPVRTIETEVVVSLGDVNDAPVLAAIGERSGIVGGVLSFTVTATDSDVPANTLTYSIDSGSETKGMSINPATGVFNWTPVSTDVGVHMLQVTASDGVLADTELISIVVLNNETNILSFTMNEETGTSTLNTTEHTVTIEVETGTDVSALTPSFTLSAGATSDPASGTVVDFGSAVTYTVTAEDGTTTQDWVVTVTEAAELSQEAAILSFALTEQTGAAVIDATNHTVDVEVAIGTDVSALTPSFTLSAGATSDPASGTAVGFGSAVTYTVTAEDGTTTQDWVVTVTEAAELSQEAAILSFALTEQTDAAVIDATNHTVDVEVAIGTDVSGLTPSFTLSAGATSDPASGTAVDFSSAVTYTVTAEDGVTASDWVVRVTQTEVLGMGEDLGWSFFPNPVHNILQVKADEVVTVYMMSLSGRRVLSEQKGTDIELDVSGLEMGVYFLMIQNEKRTVAHKILKGK